MGNNTELGDYYARRDRDWYEKLVSAEEARVEVSWYNTDGERAYPEVEELDGRKIALSDQDVYDLVYGDANIYDYIEDLEESVQRSVASYDAYYEAEAEKWGGACTRDEYPYLASVQFAIYADDERLFWNTYRFVED